MNQNAIFILKMIYGQNNHHIIESCFKAFAKSYRIAVELDLRRKDQIPSSFYILI